MKKNEHAGSYGVLPRAKACSLDGNQLASAFKEWTDEYGAECVFHEIINDPVTKQPVIRFALAYSGDVKRENFWVFSEWLKNQKGNLRILFEGWRIEKIRPKHAKTIVKEDCAKLNYEYAKRLLP